MTSTSNAEIRRMADSLRDAKIAYVAFLLSLPSLGYPDVLMDLYHAIDSRFPPMPVFLHRRDGTVYQLDASEILASARALPGFGLGPDIHSAIPLSVIVRAGDDLKGAGLLHQSAPLMQFVRHFRNAAAHGNHWHFINDEPCFAASFRDVELKASMHGQQAFLNTIGPADFLDLLDDVIAHLDELATTAP